MNEPKKQPLKEFPKEWEFKRVFENAEGYLTAYKSGQTYTPRNNITSPISYQNIVWDICQKFPKETAFGLRGTLYAVLRNAWYDHHKAKEAPTQTLPTPPPEAAA